MKLRLDNLRRTTFLLALTALLPLGFSWHAKAQQLPADAATQALRDDVTRFGVRAQSALATPGANKGHWGIMITDADTRDVLYALNAAHYFQPASNAKLFTAAMALATLGPDFRIRTQIVGAGSVEHGRLQGDLVLVGAGDDNLSNRVWPFSKKEEHEGPPDKILGELADQIVARGVKEVTGDVVVDDSYFDRGRFPSGWTVDDTVWSYGAAVSAIAVDDNVMTLEVRPGKTVGAPLEVALEPRGSIYHVRSSAVTSAVAVDEPQINLSREPESRIFYLGGSLPLGAPPRRLQLAVQEPAENAAALLARLLEERGVRVKGHARARHFGDAIEKPAQPGQLGTLLAEHISPPLAEDVRMTNKLSLNLHAELMMRVAAREKARALTMDEALKFAEEFRQQIGVAKEDAMLSDGSGLSRKDLVTPQALVQLLTWAARQSWGSDFRASLPIAGEDGTLESRMKNTAAAGRVQAKTGLTDHVEGLSGYATTVRGEHLIFSIFGNGNGIASRDATDVLDAICIAMVEELGPAANATDATGQNHPAP